MTMTREITAYQWALPEGIDVPPDELQIRLDFYSQSVVLYSIDKGIITTRMVEPQEIALALMKDTPMNSGLLPEDTLWWQHRGNGIPEIVLWRRPQVWQAALQLEPFKPPKRFHLPMPGLIFLCRPAQPPAIFAVKKRPTSPSTEIYHAPLFNIFTAGNTCPGSHKYPPDISKIPESFFMSFFTIEGNHNNRSKHYKNLLELWTAIDGKKQFPLGDLVKMGTVDDILKGKGRYV